MMLSFPDMEQVAQDICERVCPTFKFLPDDLEQMITQGPVCLVERVGGSPADGVTDRATVQVSVWAATRPRAWATATAISNMMDTFTWGGMVGAVWVDQIVRDTGEQQVFTGDPDERRVVMSFRIDARKQ